MSMTTSFLNAWRNAIASRMTRIAASGSSPLTWKIGACTVFAMSVAYTVERAKPGSVVNPIWLLTTMCSVPPVS